MVVRTIHFTGQIDGTYPRIPNELYTNVNYYTFIGIVPNVSA